MNESSVLELTADALEEHIRRHDALYEDGRPEISDPLYDFMVERLRRLRPESEVLRQVGAGDGGLSPGSARVAHVTPMLSLDKAYTEAEILRWFSRFRGPALATPKIDGVAMSLRYGPGGRLIVAATRGSGHSGEVITENARYVGDVPQTIPHLGGLEVRGEAYMPLSVFRGRLAETFANPRNLTAGALKQKDAPKTGDYGVRFLAYDAIGLEDLPTESEKRARLRELGFRPVDGVVCSAEAAEATFRHFAAARGHNDFETDGVVFKVNDCAQHAELGSTAHHPRWAIAYKYQGESGTSALVGVEWSVSRTGAINPVALVEPVSLSGVTVARVTLHNLSIIERLSGHPLQLGANSGYPLAPGAVLLLTRRGGVIPHVEQVLEGALGSILVVPERCPGCGAATRRDADFLSATHGDLCEANVLRALEHFVAQLEIDGFGPKILDQLIQRGLVRAPADLFRLDVDTLAELERLGRRSAENLVSAVQSRREVGLAPFLAALGIADLGIQLARVLAARFGSLDRVREATRAELEDVDGIGAVVAEKVVTGLVARRPWIDALCPVLTIRDEPHESAVLGPLSGASFVFTGALESMTRDAARALVRECGGATPDAVSSTVRYVVLGDKDFARFVAGWRSTKLQKAEKLIQSGAPLEIISESTFLSLLPGRRG